MQLASHLTTLETSGLVRLAQSEPDLEYLFRHALVQEATYASLLKADRRILHRAVGETLEALYAEQLDEWAALLAHHFAEAGDEAQALKYFRQAGDTAARLYANSEAIQHYRHALELAKRVAPDQVHDLYFRLGRLLELVSRYPEAITLYETMAQTARAANDRHLELAALMEHAKILSTANPWYDANKAQDLLSQARPLAHTLGEAAAEARILWSQMLLGTLRPDPVEVRIEYGEQALVIARQFNLTEQLAYILHDLWYSYSGYQQARVPVILHEACELWQGLNNQPMLSEALMRLSLHHFIVGELETSLSVGGQAIAIAQACLNRDARANALTMLGAPYWELGHLGESIILLEEALSIGDSLGNVTARIGGRAELGWAMGQIGEAERGLHLLQEGIHIAQTTFPLLTIWPKTRLVRLHLALGQTAAAATLLADIGEVDVITQGLNFIPQVAIHLTLAQSELALVQGDFAQALQLVEDLYAKMCAKHLRLYRAEVLYQAGQALAALNRPVEAHAHLAEAHLEAQACHMRWARWRILLALVRLETPSQPVQANSLRAEAQLELEYLASQLPHPKWRAAFLAQPLAQEAQTDSS